MTVSEAIALVDKLKPNHYTTAQKVGWLNDLDGMLFDDVVLTHQRDEAVPDAFVPYDAAGDLQDVLIAPHPYDSIYRFWLESQIDLENAELVKYNQDAALYNQALDNFGAWYNRNYRPIHKTRAIAI